MNQYLTVEDIAVGTGRSTRTIRRAARQHGWRRQAEHTGGRGRPRYRYLVADVLASIG